MRPSNASSDNLTDCTIEVWQPRTDREFSREDARQVVENVTGFFSVLVEWARAELPDSIDSRPRVTYAPDTARATTPTQMIETPAGNAGSSPAGVTSILTRKQDDDGNKPI